jgi:hypothetical protein
MRYIIFNILLIILIIVILFKQYVIKENYSDSEDNMNAKNAGYYIGNEPRAKIQYLQRTKIQYLQKPKVQKQLVEGVNPIEYSPVIEEPAPAPVEKQEPAPVIEKTDIKELKTSCLKKLEDRRAEIDLKKSKQARESQEKIIKNQSDDQEVSLAFATYILQYKDQTNSMQNQQKDAQSSLYDMKTANVTCQGIINSFDITLEQVRTCCSTETQRALTMQQLIAEKCKGPNLILVNNLQNIQNKISASENEINNWQNVNKDLTDKINNCNKESSAIRDKITNCNKSI